MFKKILFPVDLTPDTNRILPYVDEMANKFDSEIHCVHSLYISSYYGDMGLESAAYIAEFEITAFKDVKTALKNFISENLEGRNVKSAILNGRPGHKIVEYAKENQIDLVIMGHNTIGIERAVMGSVAAYVVKYSPAPVLVISPEVAGK